MRMRMESAHKAHTDDADDAAPLMMLHQKEVECKWARAGDSAIPYITVHSTIYIYTFRERICICMHV